MNPKKFIDEALQDAPAGVSIVLKDTALNEAPLVAIEYKYSTQHSLLC